MTFGVGCGALEISAIATRFSTSAAPSVRSSSTWTSRPRPRGRRDSSPGATDERPQSRSKPCGLRARRARVDVRARRAAPQRSEQLSEERAPGVLVQAAGVGHRPARASAAISCGRTAPRLTAPRRGNCSAHDVRDKRSAQRHQARRGEGLKPSEGASLAFAMTLGTHGAVEVRGRLGSRLLWPPARRRRT
jgi:hypothetical protein